MSFADAIKAILVADSGAGGVNTLLTGGIYTYSESGRLGPNRDATPSAFDSTTGLLKPCCVVKDRSAIPDGGASDDAQHLSSYRQVEELWFYDDGDAGYATIQAAMIRAFTLLHGQHVSYAQAHWAGNVIDQRDPALDYAAVSRSDFAIVALQS